jgi:hypothetical protein
MNDRFHWIKDFSVPKLIEKNLIPLNPKNPCSIFVDSISDPEYWEKGWGGRFIKMVFSSNSNCSFILLSKSPKTILNYGMSITKVFTPEFPFSTIDIFLGYSCGNEDLIHKVFAETGDLYADFISAEPLLEDIGSLSCFKELLEDHCPNLKLIILGAETGNDSGKVHCKKEWIDHIVSEVDYINKTTNRRVSVFMKDSIKEMMGSFFRRDKLPWPCEKQDVSADYSGDVF